MNNKAKETLKIIKRCCEALEDKKAVDIKVLKLEGKSSITDYFVIATVTSEPHLRALRKEIEKRLMEDNIHDLRVDYTPESGWAIIDGFDFIIHLFISNTREIYGLEKLWKDAEVVDMERL